MVFGIDNNFVVHFGLHNIYYRTLKIRTTTRRRIKKKKTTTRGLSHCDFQLGPWSNE